MKLRKILTGSAAFVGILALTFINGPQASASADQCQDGKFCIWADPNYNGDFGQSQNSQGNLTNMDNKTTSFWNRTGKTVVLFNYANYFSSVTGAGNWGNNYPYCVTVLPGAAHYDLKSVDPLFNDTVSSFYIGGTCVDSPSIRTFQ
ncbi:peptidase inhibitor family I36 protein [Streptomyces sp. NPDC087901]|uniref:peptidase inhibitor family I36 protein n=1 Tax=Streptomyces sp. NPDC087901 TaxID=3365818 RepID=UPI0038221AC4